MKLRLAGVGSVLPAPSVARTSKPWEPSARPPSGSGLEHPAQVPPSRRHSKLDPASEELNEKLALAVPIVPDGPEVILVRGGPVSGL